MSIRIFISYRRADSRQAAGRLRDHLANAFGDENIFFDVDSIEFGADFRMVVRTTVEVVDAVVAVIGPRFEVARLADEDDLVRLELAEALAQGKLIVPVLVEDARMPAGKDLPVGLHDLSYRNAAPLRPDPDFRHDVARLVESLRRTLGSRADAGSPAREPVPVDHSPPQSEKARSREPRHDKPAAPSSKLEPATVVPRLLPLNHRGAVLTVAFSPDSSMLASGSEDKTVRLWDVASGSEIRNFAGNDVAAVSVAFSPDGSTLASADGRSVRLQSVAGGSMSRTFHSRSGVRSVAFGPDGAMLAMASDAWTVRLLDVVSGAEIHSFIGHRNGVNSVVFSPDGAVLASGGDDKTVRLWDVASGNEICALAGHRKAVYSVAFSPDGGLLASGGNDRKVRLWDVAGGNEIRSFTGDRFVVRSVAVSPDGALLASGGNDMTVRLWDVASGNEICALAGHRDWIHSVVFAPNGHLLATAGGGRIAGDTNIRLWTMPG